ncbi:MAG: MobA/MobL family protein [Oscillospiraceae bacterium]|nr:MobA/MobL family protein [Oscillospiraceae bacterium]
MALYHFHVTQIKRSEGRTAVASAAYRAGEKLHNLWDGETHDYTKKGGVILAEIILPEHAPKRFYDRSTLWNEVEQAEKNYNAQLAYSFDIALQNEFSLEENIVLAREFVQKHFVSDGMICDLAVHLPDREAGGFPNPHFHVLAPIRPLNDDGTWGAKQHRVYKLDANGNRIKKENGQWEFDAVPTTNWGNPETLDMWRKAWADMVNAKFEEKGLNCRIDHRSYSEQGLDLLPTIHVGPHISKMEKKGIRTEIGELNRWIKSTNRIIRNMRATIAALKEWIQEAKEILKEPQEIYLAQLLSESHTMRNQTAATYTKGKTKAKQNNLKRFMNECNYLKQQGVLTLNDFEKYLSSVSEKVESNKSSMKQKQERLKELHQLIEDAKTYNELKPIADELKKEKYRFAKAKEKYKAEHESELRRFYMIKRKFKEKGFEKHTFPINSWQKEIAELKVQHETDYTQYKLLQKDLMLLYRIKSDIDTVIREKHPEILYSNKSKENDITL